MGTLSQPDLDLDEYDKKLSSLIYLDNNATTMLDEEVIKAMSEHLKNNHFYGNPSSKHILGENARRLIDESRDIIRQSINGRMNDQIIFTSGGTESNNFAIRGILSLNSNEIQHVITSPFEHPAVDKVLHMLREENSKIEISSVRVDHQGFIDLNHFQQLLRPETKFVTLMHSNNEIGTIQPIKEIVRLTREYSSSIIIHSDASQSMGKIVIDVQDFDLDLLTICSHKYHGPKGIAVLYVRNGIKLNRFMFGGNQENNLRAGTENLLGIIGLAKASELIVNSSILKQRIEQMKRTRDRLYQGLIQRWKEDFPFLSNPIRNGSEENCLVNTLSLSYPNLNGKLLVEQLKSQVAFSTGSACHEHQHEQIYGNYSYSLSTTLKSIGLSNNFILGTIRLSTSSKTTDEQIDRAIQIISNAIREQFRSI